MFKKIFILSSVIFFLSGSLLAQRMTRQEYIQRYQLLAISEMSRSGIPASMTRVSTIKFPP